MKLSHSLFCFAICASVTQAQTLSPPEVKSLLARIRAIRAKSPQVRADFQEEKKTHFLNRQINTSGRIWFQAPNKFRQEVSGNSPSVTVSNGHDFWIYYPNLKSTEHFTLGKGSPADAAIGAITTALNLENVENMFQVTGTKVANGYELQLLPRSPSVKRMFQRFDLRLGKELSVERMEMLKPNGDQIVRTYFNHSGATIPASAFDFTPPAGTAVSAPLGR
jgi:outer membrane lipoprotein-sorting protein